MLIPKFSLAAILVASQGCLLLADFEPSEGGRGGGSQTGGSQAGGAPAGGSGGAGAAECLEGGSFAGDAGAPPEFAWLELAQGDDEQIFDVETLGQRASFRGARKVGDPPNETVDWMVETPDSEPRVRAVSSSPSESFVAPLTPFSKDASGYVDLVGTFASSSLVHSLAENLTGPFAVDFNPDTASFVEPSPSNLFEIKGSPTHSEPLNVEAAVLFSTAEIGVLTYNAGADSLDWFSYGCRQDPCSDENNAGDLVVFPNAGGIIAQVALRDAEGWWVATLAAGIATFDPLAAVVPGAFQVPWMDEEEEIVLLTATKIQDESGILVSGGALNAELALAGEGELELLSVVPFQRAFTAPDLPEFAVAYRRGCDVCFTAFLNNAGQQGTRCVAGELKDVAPMLSEGEDGVDTFGLYGVIDPHGDGEADGFVLTWEPPVP